MNKEQSLEVFITCKDHSVSGEEFKLLHDVEYDMLVTFPKPNDADLGTYYESDDYISHTDAKRSLFENMYQWIKSYALRKKVGLVSKLNNGPGELLDIGAGTGDFLVAAKKKRWAVSGTEPNDHAKKLAEQKEISLVLETSNYENEKFDVITMWHVLEHVSNVKNQIEELQRLVKPNGYVVIAVPNFKSYDAHYYKSFWAAYDVPRHLWHFSKTSIQKLFSTQGFKLETIVPMRFDSFYVSLLSEKYQHGKMNFLKALWVGFYSNIKAIHSKEFSSHIYVLKKQ
ncbi:class I SAM-dependent methyltransferase [Aquimarina sp. U1-2]|uniref:class I SAM-dependent methyltransferase n=1 Tax=Aquimarina sp. U1-2 TaxID=2823141 RepID=UPI001AEC9EB2|nr:class I SAM-dependent methyltransferase [Aquimarina sp. U1-2]MBP2833837.1 class I SAM-dependent methyltransferase [Aquimarina sp. U1-2]